MTPIFLKRTVLVLALFSVALLLHARSSAQELSGTRGGLGGLITDTSGATIPGATVTLIGPADTRVTTTNASGSYQVTDLTPGLYTVTAERQGFDKTSAKNIEVVINRVNGLNLTLKTGTTTTTVEVDATASSIDTDSTAISTNLTQSFYNQVPVARNVGALFYTAPGVANGGGTGTSNPSIGGATGLENEYIADGVNISDAAYGGLGVWSPTYGSLGTGINLTFIQEVQVKTGAFEPKYGNADGGVVQIVTKSGGTSYHGALSAFFAPVGMSAQQRYADLFFDRVNVHGWVASQPQYDAAAEFGGYVPGNYLQHHLFFFGAYNPALNEWNWLPPSVAPEYSHGPFTNKTTVNSYAGKLSFKLNETTSLDASVFGDPSKTNSGYGIASEDTFPDYPNLNISNTSGFSRWNYGSRSETVHITSTLSPTWLVDISGTAKLSHFTETPQQNVNFIADYTALFQPGEFTAQGLPAGGFIQNPTAHDYGFGIDNQKTVNFHGAHTFSIGYGYSHAIYALTKGYDGPTFPFPSTDSAGISVAKISSNPAIVGAITNAAFNLELAAPNPTTGVVDCAPSRCPFLTGPLGTGQVFLQQERGIFSSPVAETSSVDQSIYGNDDWAVDRYVTVNAGIRWDEEQLNAVTQSYVFDDNWSPRLGVNIDPRGDRKTKIFFNFGRYTQDMPEDGALRDLSNELDVYAADWKPEANANNQAIIGPNGTVVPVFDAANLISGDPLAGQEGSNVSASGGASSIFIAPGTKLNYETEYVGGIEHQLHGFVLSARYSDRRLLRIIEDGSGASPEGALSGNVAQQFVVGNYNAKTDYFVNEVEAPYTYNAKAPNDGAPADCPVNYNTGIGGGPFLDSVGNVSGPGGACGFNTSVAGDPTPDGKPDGFANPHRHYQALELEANKNFSNNFLLRVNYRYAKLYGNYEGLYRNDNGQSDPNVSSLFDFTNGVLNLLGDQFVPGYLNTDRRQVGNLYGSYVIPSGFMRHFTGGMGLRGESGTPISELGAHPVYDDPGEVPIGGRGTVGRTPSNYQLDLHADYPVSLGERYKLKLTFDGFNVTDSRSLEAVDQDIALSYGNPNADYLKPQAFQRAFYGRGSLRFEF